MVDREDGASTRGRSCNLALVGQYQGQGASWVSPTYGHCAYMSSAFPTDLLGKNPGVHVVDAQNPADPVLSDTLTSPAMVGGTWESLKVNAKRGLLGAVAGGPIVGVGYFSVYDIAHDCAHPTLLNSFGSTQLTMPANGLGHEGGWAPTG